MQLRRACIGVFALVLGVACASTPKLSRQPTSPYIDGWLEWSATGTPLLQVAVEVPVRELQVPGESGAPDLLVVTAVLVDPAGKRLASDAWRTELAAAPAAHPQAFRRRFILSPKRPGRHHLQLGVLLRGRVLVSDWQRTFVIPAFPSLQRQLSEPVFVEADSDSLVPSHIYEDATPGRLQSSLWVPEGGATSGAPVSITWRVSQGDVEKLQGALELSVTEGSSTPFSLPLPRLPPGSYSIVLEVPAPQGGEPARSGGRWQVVPRIDAWADTLPAPEVLEVVLPATLYRQLAKAAPAEQLRLWQEALQKIAPGSTTVALDLLQDRWRQASLRFVEGEVPGWKTDRGRVYIRRGAPDEIDSLLDEYDGSRLERWRYFEGNVVFVFRDAHGTGAYALERTNADDFP